MLRFLFATRQTNGHSYKITYRRMGCFCGCNGGGVGKIVFIRNLTMQRLTPMERCQENRTAIGRYRAAMLEMMV